MSKPQLSSSSRWLSLLSSVLLLSHQANARCSHGVAERGLATHKAILAAREARETELHQHQIGGLSKRQNPPASLEQQVNILDPTQECAYYNSPLVDRITPSYPAIWEIATIVQGDQEATNAYNAIINNPNFPNLPPKGTPQGDFSGVNYSDADPDCWWTWSKCDTPKHANLPNDINTCPEPDTWGLSLDDGPNCTHNALYDFLQKNDYTASLFFIGSNVIDWPFQAQRGVADGHDIGVHTWSHRYSTALTNEQFFAELWYSRKVIKDVMGITPTTWRAPYGDVDDRIRFIANALGLTTVLWDHDTFDWQIQDDGNPNGLPTASVIQNYNGVINPASQGAYDTHGVIVLTHEIDGGTMDLVMSELPKIAQSFKHVVPITTCQNISHPYIEQNYTFPTFSEWVNGNTKMSNSTSIASSSSSSASSTTTAISHTNNTRSSSTTTTSKALAAANNAAVTSSHKGAATQTHVLSGVFAVVILGSLSILS